MAFCLWLLWLLRGGLAEDGLVDMTHMLDLELDGPLCDPSRLPEIDCEHTLWQRLLELLCRHCSANHCVSNPELAEVAHAVMQLYTTMLDQNLETFGCKHGLVAAVLFHSEHVALDFRRPSAEVEALSPPKTVSFNLTLDEMRVEPAVVETRLKSAGVPIALVNMSYLEISDSDGYPVRVQTGDDGVHTLESERDPTHGGFPLRVRYRVPPTERRFFSVQRFFAVSQGHEHSVLSIYLGLPVMSLAPFPFHTAKLYSLRRIEQEEYDAFVADISMKFSRSGLAHVVLDNDYTLRFWDVTASHSDEKGYLQNRFGLDRAPDQTLQRLSLFVPFEERSRALQLFPSSPKLIDLGLGHVQYGEQPFGFASSLNFRVMCSSCLWVSIYFYVTEALGLASTGPGMTVIPLAFWVPCRIPADELFPVANLPLGPRPGDVVPRPPLSGSQLAKQRWSGGSDPDPVFEAIREHYAVKDLQSRRRSIYYGKCRESLLRRVPQAVPELLPMHDMSSFLKLSMENTLEFIMGFRQMHKAAGLELYQDKIQLAKDFEARGYHVPKIFYASYAEDFDVLPTLQALEAQGRAYVAKASHLCCSQGVFVMDSGVERLTNQSLRPEDIQQQLQHAYAHPLSEDQVDPKCGDWGTVEAGKKPGVLVEELYRPSLPASFLDVLGADWVSPDVLACHLVWSTLYLCRWEINVRRSGERHTELLGTVFRDGSCLSCRYPLLELVNWPSTVQMLEALLPHTDYVRISIFLHETREPVINEVEYTTGGLEVFPVPIAREWTLRWLEGYYAFLS